MYASPSRYYRAPGRQRQRPRSQSDPGHPFVSPPYTVQWPPPARRTTEPMTMNPQRTSSNSSVERVGDPFAPPPGSLLAQYQVSASPAGSPTTPSPRSPSPQRSGHQRSSSRHGSIRMPQPETPLIREVPRPSRTALNTPLVIPTPQPPGLGQEHGSGNSGYAPTFPVPQQNSPVPSVQGITMPVVDQGSYQSMHDSATQLTRHASNSGSTAPQQGGHYYSSSHHLTHHRSRSRPPGAPSHRYVSSTTQPVYGHVSSGNLNASRTSFDAGVPSSRNHHATSPPPGTSSTSNRPAASPNNVSSRSHSRSRSHTRPPPSPTTITTTTAHASTKRRETHTYTPAPTPAAMDVHRSSQRPGFPANYDGHTQTRYMNMLLALDDIPPLFNLMASFFTWILLAGFVLFPGTFASWKNQNTSETETQILGLVNKVSLYVIAWICTGIGGCGMTWLWWRWQNNYIWITNRVFVPGLLNSVAGIISTLASIYGAQAGTFGTAEKSTVIVTGVIAVICGLLVIIYQFLLLGNLKKEHDREVGVEKAGKHGEGVLGEKKLRRRSEV